MKKSILLNSALLISGAAIITSCNKTPEATFTADKATCVIGESVMFTDAVAERKNATISYDFGDGSSQIGQNISHVYNRPGKYTVTMNVMGNKNANKGKGKYASSTQTIEVKGAEAKITASKTTANFNDVINFTNASTNIDKGYKCTYEWWIADDQGNTWGGSSKKDYSFRFQDGGTYTVYLRVTQGWDYESVATQTVTVNDANGSDAYSKLLGIYASGSTNGSVSYSQSCAGTVVVPNVSLKKTWVNSNGSIYSLLSDGNQAAGEQIGTISDAGDGYVNVNINNLSNGTNNWPSQVNGRYKLVVTSSGATLTYDYFDSKYSQCWSGSSMVDYSITAKATITLTK